MLKIKHNKKRNTAVIYEILIRELTKAIINKKEDAKEKTVDFLKEHFSKNTLMAKELELYKALCETYNLNPRTAEKLVIEIRQKHEEIDDKLLFKEQSELIQKINKSLGKSFFNNFIPNYKTLATIYQVFNQETSTKDKVLLEENIISNLTLKRGSDEQAMKSMDSLTYKTFVNNFNVEYGQKLFKEQKELLSKYVASFIGNSVELKVFLNEEIARLKKVISDGLNLKEIKDDQQMQKKTKEVLETINKFKDERINKTMLEKVLQIQELAREIMT